MGQQKEKTLYLTFAYGRSSDHNTKPIIFENHMIQKLRRYFSWLLGSKKNVLNMHHPKFEGMIEYAFTANGTDFYNFKEDKDSQMPYGRHVVILNLLQEINLRMNFKLLEEYVKAIKKNLTTTQNNRLDIGKAILFLEQLESRMKLNFSSDTAYRLASVVYFDSSEILSSYDKKHCDKKIERWKEANCLDFFYTRPFSELIGLKNTTQPDLMEFLTAMEQLDEASISALQRQ